MPLENGRIQPLGLGCASKCKASPMATQPQVYSDTPSDRNTLNPRPKWLERGAPGTPLRTALAKPKNAKKAPPSAPVTLPEDRKEKTRKSTHPGFPLPPPWAPWPLGPSRASAMTFPEPRAQAAPFSEPLQSAQTLQNSSGSVLPIACPPPRRLQWWELRATALNPKRQWFGWWPVKGREKKPSTNENCWTALQTNAFA